MLTRYLLAVLSILACASAHFILQSPTSIGFDDETLDVAPCGGFAPNNRTNGVTRWPHKGGPISLISTHSESVWEFKAAVLSNTNRWVNLSRNITQTGVGSICFPNILGKLNWAGRKGVIQVTQHTHHGGLYQCSAVKFTIGPAKPMNPSACFNDTGVSAYWGNPEHDHDDDHGHGHRLF